MLTPTEKLIYAAIIEGMDCGWIEVDLERVLMNVFTSPDDYNRARQDRNPEVAWAAIRIAAEVNLEVGQVVQARRYQDTITSLDCYESNSGNKTWKGWTQAGRLIYLRQADRDLFIEAGVWDIIDQMAIGDEHLKFDIPVTIFRDQDFWKIESINMKEA